MSEFFLKKCIQCRKSFIVLMCLFIVAVSFSLLSTNWNKHNFCILICGFYPQANHADSINNSDVQTILMFKHKAFISSNLFLPLISTSPMIYGTPFSYHISLIVNIQFFSSIIDWKKCIALKKISPSSVILLCTWRVHCSNGATMSNGWFVTVPQLFYDICTVIIKIMCWMCFSPLIK